MDIDETDTTEDWTTMSGLMVDCLLEWLALHAQQLEVMWQGIEAGTFGSSKQ